jgi:hypothetical protein
LGGDDSTALGGLVGQNLGAISRCRAETSASGVRLVGGLLGSLWSGVVTNSYATGTVTGEYLVGGLAGYRHFAEIVDCYATTKVSTEGDGGSLGGLVGYDGGDWQRDKIRSSFWDIEASGVFVSAGGRGVTTTAMQDANTYLAAGWDFDEISMICEGRGYPHLQWEGVRCAE